jgi:hypothetical protein
MSRRVDPVGSKKCPVCGEIKPLEGFSIKVRQPDGSTKYEALDCFKIKGKRPDGSVRYETKCNSCRNKGGGVLWLSRSKTHKTCRRCGELTLRSAFKPKQRNQAGEVVNWMPVCIKCQRSAVRFPHLHRTDTHKTCGECGLLKPLSDFSTKGRAKSGAWKHSAKCKPCVRQAAKSPKRRRAANHYYARNRQTMLVAAKESYQRHKKKRVAQKAHYRDKNREKIRQWFAKKRAENPEYWSAHKRASYAKHAEKWRQYRREYVRKFPDKVRETNRKQLEKRYASGKAQAYSKQYRQKNQAKLRAHERNYRKTDINRNISMKLRTRIRTALRLNQKSESTEKLLGCTISELAVHLQSRFEQGMNWEKFLAGEIHIDHIVPCILFELSLPEEQAECFHFSNLQPLWATDNLRKPKYVDPTGKRSKSAKARR